MRQPWLGGLHESTVDTVGCLTNRYHCTKLQLTVWDRRLLLREGAPSVPDQLLRLLAWLLAFTLWGNATGCHHDTHATLLLRQLRSNLPRVNRTRFAALGIRSNRFDCLVIFISVYQFVSVSLLLSYQLLCSATVRRTNLIEAKLFASQPGQLMI